MTAPVAAPTVPPIAAPFFAPLQPDTATMAASAGYASRRRDVVVCMGRTSRRTACRDAAGSLVVAFSRPTSESALASCTDSVRLHDAFRGRLRAEPRVCQRQSHAFGTRPRRGSRPRVLARRRHLRGDAHVWRTGVPARCAPAAIVRELARRTHRTAV